MAQFGASHLCKTMQTEPHKKRQHIRLCLGHEDRCLALCSWELLYTATPTFEVKRHRASNDHNDRRAVPLRAMLPQTSRALLTNARLMSPDNQGVPALTLESMTNGARQVIK